MKKLILVQCLFWVSLCVMHLTTNGMQSSADIEVLPEITEEAQHVLTPLHEAARQGNIDQLNTLIAAGANKEAEDTEDNTPLHLAVIHGHVEMVNALIAAGANKEAQVGYNTPLHLAVIHGHVDIVNALIAAGANKEAQDIEGQTPLHLAVIHGHVDIVNALTAAGANKEAQDEEGNTPLHWAVARCRFDMVNVLIAARANINAQDNHGLTPLHTAAMYGLVACANALIEAGANLEAEETEEEGQTPLHSAAVNGHVDVVNALIEAGANVEAPDHAGKRPLHCAAYQCETDCVNALLAAGADVESEDHEGKTPLHLAVSGGTFNKGNVSRRALVSGCVNALLAAGAKIEAEDMEGVRPLHMAALHEDIDGINILIASGANIEAEDTTEERRTPLHWAINSLSTLGIQALFIPYENYCPTKEHFDSAARRLKVALLALRYAQTGETTPKLINPAGNEVVINNHLKVEIFQWLNDDLVTVFLYKLAKGENIEFPLFTVEETAELVISYILNKIKNECMKLQESGKLEKLIAGSLINERNQPIRSLLDPDLIDENYRQLVGQEIKKRILELRTQGGGQQITAATSSKVTGKRKKEIESRVYGDNRERK